MADVAQHHGVHENGGFGPHVPADLYGRLLADGKVVESSDEPGEGFALGFAALEPVGSEGGRDRDLVPVVVDEVEGVAFQGVLVHETPVPDLVRADDERGYPGVELLLLLLRLVPAGYAVERVLGLEEGRALRGSFRVAPVVYQYRFQPHVLEDVV